VAAFSVGREGLTAASGIHIHIQEQQQSHLIESDQGNAAAEALKEDSANALKQLEGKSSSSKS
jgi:hypothetical protein